jgi:hypothetical protein
MNPYQRNGFANRTEYLTQLAESYGLHVGKVFDLAYALGPAEDFDGLIRAVHEHHEELVEQTEQIIAQHEHAEC